MADLKIKLCQIKRNKAVKIIVENLNINDMIDNIELIKPLFNFSEPGDFYMLYVLKRKKDQSTDKSNHQSVRTIKSYCIESIEYLEERYDEIKMLCEVFKARAYIHIQSQNHKTVGLQMISQISTRLQNGHNNQRHVFDSVVGQLKTREKYWIVDIDSKDELIREDIRAFINGLRPEGYKCITEIPTKNGYHLITNKFDVMAFSKKYPVIDIQKKNPTMLYLPDSLDN